MSGKLVLWAALLFLFVSSNSNAEVPSCEEVQVDCMNEQQKKLTAEAGAMCANATPAARPQCLAAQSLQIVTAATEHCKNNLQTVCDWGDENPEMKKCPDGTQIPIAQTCPTLLPPITCRDGKKVANVVECEGPVTEYKQCPDGTAIPVGQACKEDPIVPPTNDIYTNPQIASQMADQDIAMCLGKKDYAYDCCNGQCSSGTTQQNYVDLAALAAQMQASNNSKGLKAACQQMQSLGGNGRAVNADFASVCSGKKMTCENTCGQMVQKYSAYLNNCSNCASGFVFEQALNEVNQSRHVCASLAANVNAIGNQAVQSQASGVGGSACDGLTNASAAGVGGNNFGDPLADQKAKALENAEGARFAKVIEEHGDFNTPDISPTNPNGQYGVPPSENPYQSNPALQVPNNTGGAIPGQASSQAASAGGSEKTHSSSSGGYNTDVLNGTYSGGYSQPVGSSAGNSLSGMWSKFFSGGSASAVHTDESKMLGVDLKRYLPGGPSDPSRNLAGLRGISREIGPKGGDIFKIVSDRYRAVCRFDRLLECFK